MNHALISVIGDALTFSNNSYGRTKTLEAYICTPDREIKCRMRGITAFNVSAKGFNDYSSISFSVTKFVTNQSTLVAEQNDSYNYIHAFCLVFVPEFGKLGYFMVAAEPTIQAMGERDETKSFTAISYEGILQYENLVGFSINQGTTESLEMYEENVDALGLPEHNIRLYNPENPKLSLLDLALHDDYYGWEVGHVDETIASLERSFAIDNQNVYSFLCNDVSRAFQCVFTFDTVNLLVNCYDVKSVGENTNIYLSLDHFLSEIDISPRTDDIYTVFNVAGGEDLDISPVNFGSNKIINIAYPMAMLDEGLRIKYARYVAARDSYRAQYRDDNMTYHNELMIEQSILDRGPDDAVYNNWSSTVYYPTDELEKYLENYRTAVSLIEEIYTNEQGVLDTDALDVSSDASTYYSYRDVCIPDITAELKYRKDGTEYESIDYNTVWNLYGLTELETKRDGYRELIAALKEQGYDGKWDPSSTISKETFDAHHAEYVQYSNYLTQLDALISKKTRLVEESRQRQQTVLDEMADLAEKASLQYYVGDIFDQEEVDIITALYRESDYQNENIITTEIDDLNSSIEKSEQLYEDAWKRLLVESVPQFTWSISSANLFAMKEFEPLRNQLQVGSFINLYYGGELYDPTDVPDQYRITEEDGERVSEDGTPIISSQGGWAGRFVSRQTLKFRVIEIDFDGINFDGDFNVIFTDMTQTKMYRSDLENIIGSMVSSSANSISGNVTSAASSTAAIVANSILRPYMSVLNAKIQEASIDNANILNLDAINARVENLVADYLKAHTAEIFELYVDIIKSDDESSWWNLRTGELCLNGYMINTQVEYTIGDSRLIAPTENWGTEMPTVTPSSPYIWMRTKMTLDGSPPTVLTSAPACITGNEGDSPIYVQITSSAGETFKKNSRSTTLTCTVWSGVEDITSTVDTFTWTRANDQGVVDPSWTRTTNVNHISITDADFVTKAIFGCEVSVNNEEGD